MEALQGRIVGRKYRLIRLIGRGGMGTVWEAEHTAIRHRVAVKIMRRTEGDSPENLKRFFREAKAAGEIGHPNIIEIYDVGVENDGTAYMVMELLRGESLGELLLARKKLPPVRVVSILIQVLSALHTTHQKGIIHRDLKPDNVFLSVDARLREDVKLLDFGIAKIQAAEFDSVKLTKPETVLGTPHYLSPEQAAGSRDIDARIDIWAIGVMMFEMLTGEVPFGGENYNEVIGHILMNPPPALRDLEPTVPEDLAHIVSKAMCKDRDQRYQSVAELMRDLLPWSENYDQGMGTDAALAVADLTEAALKASLPNALEYKKTVSRPQRPSAPTIPLSSSDLEIGAKASHPWLLRATVAAAAVAAIALGAGVTAYILGQGDAPPHDPSGAVQPPALASQPRQSPPALSSPATQTAAAAQDTINLQIVDLPPVASVFWDGKRVLVPGKIARSATPSTLRVTCPGYRPYVQTVTPSQDLMVEIDWKKLALRGTSAKEKRSDSSRKGWKNNPFSQKRP